MNLLTETYSQIVDRNCKSIPKLRSLLIVHPCDKKDQAGCEHQCNKKGDEAVCSCDDGYLLAEDGQSCKESKCPHTVDFDQYCRQIFQTHTKLYVCS